MNKPKLFFVVIEECDASPQIERMTREEIIEMDKKCGGEGYAVFDGDLLKSLNSRLQANLLR